MLLGALLALLLGAPAAPVLAAQPGALPLLPPGDAVDLLHGQRVPDPYRRLEQLDDPAVVAWMKAQSAYAHAVLAAIPGRARLRAQLDRLDNSAPARITDVRRSDGGRLFYERRNPHDDQLKLYVREGLRGRERLLFDPEALQRRSGVPHAVNYFSPSPDGRWVALGVSAGGSEEASLRVLDVATGRLVGPAIARVDDGPVAWSPDGEWLFFNRLRQWPAGASPAVKYQYSALVMMPPGGTEADLRTVVTAGVDLDIPPTEFPSMEIAPDGRVLLYASDSVSPDFAAWHSTLDAVLAGRPAWRPLVTRADQVTALALSRDRVFALSYHGAPRYKLIGGPLDGFRADRAELLLPEGEAVLTGLAVAAEGVYVRQRVGNTSRLLRLGLLGGPAQDVPLPVAGSFEIDAARADLPGLLLEIQGWTTARRIVAVTPLGEVHDTGLQPAGPYDHPADVVADEVLVDGPDGVRVPMSIVHRRGVAPDGSHPTLLYGYAAYGDTDEPWFSYGRLAWLEAGGVFAVANPRGSGVYGRAWHEAGQKATKPNSWRDFIACAEYLVKTGWTTPRQLAIWGGSAGGILVGRAMTTRPDLFAAVVPEVGALDMIRSEDTPNGPPNIPEFGTIKDPDEFRALLDMSTYHQIRDGVAYPAVLLIHGVNDPRVEVWNSSKTAARLQAATSSGKPVLLRLDWQAGHGIGSTQRQVLDELADVYAFVLWQTGAPGWQPRPLNGAGDGAAQR